MILCSGNLVHGGCGVSEGRGEGGREEVNRVNCDRGERKRINKN